MQRSGLSNYSKQSRKAGQRNDAKIAGSKSHLKLGRLENVISKDAEVQAARKIVRTGITKLLWECTESPGDVAEKIGLLGVIADANPGIRKAKIVETKRGVTTKMLIDAIVAAYTSGRNTPSEDKQRSTEIAKKKQRFFIAIRKAMGIPNTGAFANRRANYGRNRTLLLINYSPADRNVFRKMEKALKESTDEEKNAPQTSMFEAMTMNLNGSLMNEDVLPAVWERVGGGDDGPSRLKVAHAQAKRVIAVNDTSSNDKRAELRAAKEFQEVLQECLGFNSIKKEIQDCVEDASSSSEMSNTFTLDRVAQLAIVFIKSFFMDTTGFNPLDKFNDVNECSEFVDRELKKLGSISYNSNISKEQMSNMLMHVSLMGQRIAPTLESKDLKKFEALDTLDSHRLRTFLGAATSSVGGMTTPFASTMSPVAALESLKERFMDEQNHQTGGRKGHISEAIHDYHRLLANGADSADLGNFSECSTTFTETKMAYVTTDDRVKRIVVLNEQGSMRYSRADTGEQIVMQRNKADPNLQDGNGKVYYHKDTDAATVAGAFTVVVEGMLNAQDYGAGQGGDDFMTGGLFN